MKKIYIEEWEKWENAPWEKLTIKAINSIDDEEWDELWQDISLKVGLTITTDDNGNKETIDINNEDFSTELADCCEMEIRYIKPYWDLDYYLNDIRHSCVDPVYPSKVLVCLKNNFLIIEDNGDLLSEYKDKTKVSIDITNHNLLQVIVGYEGYFYRGFEIVFKKKGIMSSEVEEETIFDAHDILCQEVKWLKSLSWDSKEIINRYKRDGYLRFEFSDFIIKVEMENSSSFDFDIDFRCLKSSIYTVLEIKINDHVRFYVYDDTTFTINDTIKFTIEKKRS